MMLGFRGTWGPILQSKTDQKIISSEEVEINEVLFTKNYWSAGPTTLTAYTNYRGRVYTLSFAVKPGGKEETRIFNQILSTFRFVDVKKSLQKVPPGYDSMRIEIKFRLGTDVESPIEILPLKLLSSVSEIRQSSSLSDKELERIGAESFKRWFVIVLKPGTDPVEFINKLLDLDTVEIAEFAPLPAPPP